MSRNGTGTYSLPAGNPVTTGTVISSTWANGTLTDIATALTQSIASTGVTTPTANLPMGTYRHTGVGNATVKAAYASVTDVQNGSLVTLGAVAGTDTITATAPFTLTAYAAGQGFQFVAASTNTGAVTINIDTVGAKSITKAGTVPLGAGDIIAGQVVQIVYDGTQFQMIGARQGGSVAAQTVTSRSSDTIFSGPDLGSMNQYTGSFTQTFTAAATLGSGWRVDVQNIGTGVITFDANGAETFNTQAGARTTISMYPGEGFSIVCNGSGFDLVGRSTTVVLERQTASGSAVAMEIGFTDTELNQIDIRAYDAILSGQFSVRVKKSGSYVTGGTYYYGISYSSGAAATSLTGQTEGAVNPISSIVGQTGTLSVVRPTATSGAQQIRGDFSAPVTSDQGQLRMMSGIFETTVAAIQGIRFSGGAAVPGSITSGEFVSIGYRG